MLILLIFTWHSWIWFWVTEVLCGWAMEAVVITKVTGTTARAQLLKLCPKEVGTRSAVTEPRLAAPEVMAWTEVVNSFRPVLVAWLSYSHSLAHTVSMRLKSQHWFASYSCWPATLSPRPDWQTAFLQGHSSCRHTHKGDFKMLSILLRSLLPQDESWGNPQSTCKDTVHSE